LALGEPRLVEARRTDHTDQQQGESAIEVLGEEIERHAPR